MKRTAMTRTAPLRRSNGEARLTVPVFKPKACRVCHARFTPTRQIQPVCAEMSCSIAYAEKLLATKKAKAALDDRRATKEKLAKLKSRSDWLKEAQTEFNAYIRLRDAARPCISCGRHHDGQWHAGHYLSTGARPELRFDESNVHKQCQPCNTHLHGNLVLYRAELIRRIGLLEVIRLEGPHAPLKLTVVQLQSLKAEYAARVRLLRKAMA